MAPEPNTSAFQGTVAFTGRLASMKREEAFALVRRKGGTPRRGLTMGLADILQSRAILLLVSGRQKIAPLRRMMNGRVTTRCPASLLWLHADVTVFCDRESSPALDRAAR